MIPDDPLGKNGPHLDIFLRKDYRCVLKVYKVQVQKKTYDLGPFYYSNDI